MKFPRNPREQTTHHSQTLAPKMQPQLIQTAEVIATDGSLRTATVVGNVPVSHELDKCVPLQVFTYLLSF